jgi:general secretion pathway protein I
MRMKYRVPSTQYRVPTRRCRRAFSLLEVILALAILAGAVVVLGELTRQGMECTRLARDSTYAQLLCESKLSEIIAGVAIAQDVQGAPIDLVQAAPLDADTPPGQAPWIYSVRTSGPTNQNGLIAVEVTVSQDMPEANRPARCTLVRWMIDPNIDWSSMNGTDQTSTGSTGSSPTGTNPTPGGGS